MLLYLRNSIIAEDAFEDSYRSANYDIITDILHDGRCLSGYQSQQHWRLVQVPEQKQLPSTGRRTANVAKQVGIRVPEYSVKAQHYLQIC